MATSSRWDMSNWKPGTTTLLQALGAKWQIAYPKVTATLATTAAQAQKNGGGTTASGNISTQGATGAKGLYNALRSAGASQNQAIAMIANAMNESSLNPEAAVRDSNGYMSYGLWQFNAASYPNASSLVTGNAAKDMIAQIQYLFQVGGLNAASGSTPAAAAGNFAANFEKCEGCEPGGAQNSERQANAATVLQELGLS
jgi:Phage tail lysozyme